MTISIYEPRTMAKALEEMKPANTFLKRLFFGKTPAASVPGVVFRSPAGGSSSGARSSRGLARGTPGFTAGPDAGRDTRAPPKESGAHA